MAHWVLTYAPILALSISLLALVASCLSLGWNIYRDVIMKPKLRVRVSISRITTDNIGTLGSPLVVVSASNFGPGQLTCLGVTTKKSSLWRKLLRRVENFVIIPDFSHPHCATLPKRLNMAEEAHIIFPYNAECLLSSQPSHIGIYDSFGRTHWASRTEVKEVNASFLKAFKIPEPPRHLTPSHPQPSAMGSDD